MQKTTKSDTNAQIRNDARYWEGNQTDIMFATKPMYLSHGQLSVLELRASHQEWLSKTVEQLLRSEEIIRVNYAQLINLSWFRS